MHPGFNKRMPPRIGAKAFPFSLPYAPQFLILIPYAGPRNSRSAGPQFPIARHAIPGSFLTGPGAAQFRIEIPIRISTTQFLIEIPIFVELYLGVLVDFRAIFGRPGRVLSYIWAS